MDPGYDNVSRATNRETQLKPVNLCQDDHNTYTDLLTVQKESCENDYEDIRVAEKRTETRDNENSSAGLVKSCDKFKKGVIICTLVNAIIIILTLLVLRFVIIQYYMNNHIREVRITNNKVYLNESSSINSNELIHNNQSLHQYEELLKYAYSNISSFLKLIGQDEDYPASSCSHIYYLREYSSDGYYWIKSREGNSVQLYCRFFSCSYSYFYTIPGEIRITKLNKTGNFTQCFSGMKPYSVNASSCVARSDSATCSHTIFSTHNIPYSRVCGFVRAYGVGTADGFSSSSYSINDNYVDGISLSYGSFPNRKHIHTFTASTHSRCYSNKPSFVRNYNCLRVETTGSSFCTRCTKYFGADLGSLITEDIEMRVCRDQSRSDEDVVIEDLEIYVQ